MSHSRKLIVPAAIVIGLFVAAPLVVGFEDAAASGHRSAGFSGGMGSQKNGGGDHSKNGGSDHGKNDGNGNDGRGEHGMSHGDDGRGEHGMGHGGHRGGRRSGNSSDNVGGDTGFSFGAGSGSSMSYGQDNIICVVNGRVIPVRSVSECRYGRGYAHDGDSYFGGNSGYHFSGGYASEGSYYTSSRHYRYATGYESQNGFGYGGYDSERYIGSPAAVMQAHRRMREGYGSMSNGGYSTGYYYGGGYGYVGNEGYGADGGYHGNDMSVRSRHHRRGHRMMGGYSFGGQGGCDCGSYNPGYVVHYGPTISKDGGY